MPELEELGHALTAVPDRNRASEYVLEHVLGLLALTPSPERAAAVARIAADLPDANMRRPAALLAAAQSEPTLLSLLAGDLPTELAACLLHEMILRRRSVTAVADLWAPRLAGHPLAELPLHALPGETRVPLSDYSIHGRSFGIAAGPRDNPLTFAGTVPVVSRAPAPAELTSAVATWLTTSHGRCEATLFRCRVPLSPDEVGVHTLESLGLDCLAGNGLALHRAGLDDVVPMLFGAAAGGGAYTQGLGGAYGRAAAWRSLNALAGGTHVGCSWWTFDAANDWFRRVAWDLGVVCLRPGGHVLAVLAATDTD